ncbi:MAG: nucleoside deaminase [Clostridium sp.]|nr:nucleoside deaminase [Clostridium sp.]
MDSVYMKSAIAEAEKAYAEGETPVGAVIVRDGEIIASAHNMTERLNDSTAHAELMAIQAAEKATGDTGAALNSRIEEIVFGAWDPEMGSCGSRTDVTDGRLPRRAKTMGGVLEEDCQRLLRDFFREKRGK